MHKFSSPGIKRGDVLALIVPSSPQNWYRLESCQNHAAMAIAFK